MNRSQLPERASLAVMVQVDADHLRGVFSIPPIGHLEPLISKNPVHISDVDRANLVISSSVGPLVVCLRVPGRLHLDDAGQKAGCSRVGSF